MNFTTPRNPNPKLQPHHQPSEKDLSKVLTDTSRQFLGGPSPVGLTVAFSLANELEALPALHHGTAAESVAISCHPAMGHVAWLATGSGYGECKHIIFETKVGLQLS